MIPNDVLYWTSSFTNNTDAPIKCRMLDQYNRIVVEHASEWMVRVVRLQCDLSLVPYFEGGTVCIIVGNALNIPIAIGTCYSYSSFIFRLSEALNPYGFTLTEDDDTIVTLTLTDTYNGELIGLTWTDIGKRMLGIPDRPLNMTLALRLSSLSGRLGVGRYSHHIMVQTNLPVASDRLGQKNLRILYDFDIPVQRQSIGAHVETPNERWCNMHTDIPLDQFEIDLYSVDKDTTLRALLLPVGGTITIKLQFYKKR